MGFEGKNNKNKKISKLGYSVGSPYRNSPFLDIHTPNGNITMANTDIPLMGIDETGMVKVMPPYSGTHQFRGSRVREIPLYQEGGMTAQGIYDFLFPEEEEAPKKKKKENTAPSTEELEALHEQIAELESHNAQYELALGVVNEDSPRYQTRRRNRLYSKDGSTATGTSTGAAPADVPKNGSIAISHNNPGNIKYGDFAAQFGASPGRPGTDGGVFAVFPDVQTGLQARQALLTGKSYRGRTVDAAMRRWSNNGYGGDIYPEVASKKIEQLSEAELAELTRRQIQREDGNMYRQLRSQGILRQGGKYRPKN